MMSRPSWWRWCAGTALLEIVIITYGFVVEPVAWQIVVLPAFACVFAVGVVVCVSVCVLAFAWPFASALPCDLACAWTCTFTLAWLLAFAWAFVCFGACACGACVWSAGLPCPLDPSWGTPPSSANALGTASTATPSRVAKRLFRAIVAPSRMMFGTYPVPLRALERE